MSKIPEAIDVWNKHTKHLSWGDRQLCQTPTYYAMIEFAKLHVKAALEAAANKSKTKATEEYYNHEFHYTLSIDRESILNAYPDNLIQ